MLNQVVMVGRLLEKPEIKELENGKKVGNITLIVPRCYKNEDGEYEKDEGGSFKIQIEDDKSYYYHEALSEAERISIQVNGGYYFRQI